MGETLQISAFHKINNYKGQMNFDKVYPTTIIFILNIFVYNKENFCVKKFRIYYHFYVILYIKLHDTYGHKCLKFI